MCPNAKYSNRLAETTSPYLRQHAHNPVDWWPWCAEALASAREHNKPILLSIGYSACHWCHVMAHESFEDPETATLMNKLYVNIKVDREERPDLDRIYQSAHQLLTQRPGGWPLTVFLSSEDQTPFFAGTYFPPEPRHGLPSFKDLLGRIEYAYRAQADAIRAQNSSLIDAMDSFNPTGRATGQVLDSTPLDLARRQLGRNYDATHGGFGQAPKFPHATHLEVLIRHWAATANSGHPDAEGLAMTEHTLQRMALGGINDQLGGGFCRYSVDDHWMIPHFEKMLYDNGPLLALYCDAWQATANPLYRDTALATADWVVREMQSPEGGYYASLDADSEGQEGKFYVWNSEEVRLLLDNDEHELVAARYGLDRKPNFEGQWHLHTYLEPEVLGRTQGLASDELKFRLDNARRKLFQAREQRIRPNRDDKILSAWNALMIKGMARAARVFGRSDYLESAQRARDFIRGTLWRDERLRASYNAGKSHLNAYLDDYAFLIEALLELLQTRWDRADLDWCLALSDILLERFEDAELGGFFFTSSDHERLIHRSKPLSDDSLPAGNGVAARVLLRLGHLTGDTRYLHAAERTLQVVWEQLAQIPYAHASLLMALEEQLYPPEILIIRGEEDKLAQWHHRANAGFAPRRMILAIPVTASDLPGSLASMQAGNSTTAYRCTGTHCDPPIKAFADLDTALRPTEIMARG